MKKTENCELKTFFNPLFERRNAMKKMNVLLMMVLAIGFGVSVVQADFTEDFESYNSPYENVQARNNWTAGSRYLRAKDSCGFNGSKGATDLSANWTAAENYQDISNQGLVPGSGNQVFSARLYADEASEPYAFPSISMGSAIGSDDYVYVELYHNQIVFKRYLDGNSMQMGVAATGLSDATWYDVKMEFNMDEGSAGKVWWVGYRPSTVGDTGPWTRLNDDRVSYFHYDLAQISLNSLKIAVRSGNTGEIGRIDDIMITPEPVTIGLMLLGLVGLIRRR